MNKKFTLFENDSRTIKFDLEKHFQSSALIDIHRLTRKTVKLLVVVDEGPFGGVAFAENSSFGVGRFIKLMRDTVIGCTDFEVDIAFRPHTNGATPGPFSENFNPGPSEARYLNFRFDQEVDGELLLNRYHELFLFGFAPDNNAGPDSNISDHPWYTTDNEIVALHAWMNAGGGVFATGDHDYLGASMCHRIPRVGTMRKWTNEDGVPPIGGVQRIDTLQPANAAEAAGGGSLDNNVQQYDAVPQAIEWLPNKITRSGFFEITEPHPVLCHPTHGPIDVMPDHAHEGCCFDPDTEINYSATVPADGEPEYPSHSGFQPKPKIIAKGRVVARPNYAKGAVNAREFLMISVYDGRENNASNTGRVVVDSTWHHWLNLNVVGLEAAPDQTNWEKVSRYFINVARWLAPKNTFAAICWWDIVNTHFEYPGLHEIRPTTPLLEVGNQIWTHLSRRLGPCEVRDFILLNICEINPSLCRLVEDIRRPDLPFDPLDPRCLTCPPLELLNQLVLGAAFRGTEGLAKEISGAMAARKGKVFEVNESTVAKAALPEINKALKDFGSRVVKGQQAIAQAFAT